MQGLAAACCPGNTHKNGGTVDIVSAEDARVPPLFLPPADVESELCPAVATDETQTRAWPDSADIQYFNCELKLAFTYLCLATDHPSLGRECRDRALRLYVLLSGWVQSNGGDPRFEQHLQRLRWRTAALHEPDDLPSDSSAD